VKTAEVGGDDELDTLAEAHGALLDLVLAQQIDDLMEGLPATNAVTVRTLSKRERERMRLALQAAASAGALTRELLSER
jgi:DNA polymerase-3 subunit epsilon/CBS domain-containing protein